MLVLQDSTRPQTRGSASTTMNAARPGCAPTADVATWTAASSATATLALSCQSLDSPASMQTSAVKTLCAVSEAGVLTLWALTSVLVRSAFNLHQTEPFAETSTSAENLASAIMASASTLRVAFSASVILVTRPKEGNVSTSTSAREIRAWAANAPTHLAAFTVSVLQVSCLAAMAEPALTASLGSATQSSSQENAAIPRRKWSPSQHAVVVGSSLPTCLDGVLRVPRAQVLAVWSTSSCAPTVLASPTVGTTSTNVPK